MNLMMENNGMNDIVERLRKLWFAQNPKLTWDDMEAITEEAAAEITRLRAENEKLRKAVAVERERCAKIADKFEGWSGSFVARAIRDADFEKRWEGDAAAAIRESGYD